MFESARLKLQRADYHISDLERQFAAFVAEKPHRFQSNPNTGSLGIRVRFIKEIPTAFALVIGDAIHNLPASLDDAILELIGIDHGTQDRHLKFPTGDTRGDNCVVRSAAIHFFIAQQSDSAIWL
jgi:hypothetical protein